MKKTMNHFRRMLAIAICAMVSLTAMSADEKPINVNQLPATAQQTLKKHFPKMKVAMAKVDNDLFDKSYDVIFTNGTKVEFDKNGNWTEVKCKNTAVPTAFIPTQIQNYLKEHYPGEKVVGIERDARGYEVELANKFELTFNKNFKLVDIDN